MVHDERRISPVGALVLVVWLAAGGFAVLAFLRQPQPTALHWVSLVVGVLMVALGLGIGSLGFYMLWKTRRSMQFR